jgi:hypothetical protein
MLFSIAAPHAAVGTAAIAPSASAVAPSPGSASAKKDDGGERRAAAAATRTSASADKEEKRAMVSLKADKMKEGGKEQCVCFPARGGGFGRGG